MSHGGAEGFPTSSVLTPDRDALLSSQPRGLHFPSCRLAATHQHNCEDQQDVYSRGRLRWLGGRLGGRPLLWDDVGLVPKLKSGNWPAVRPRMPPRAPFLQAPAYFLSSASVLLFFLVVTLVLLCSSVQRLALCVQPHFLISEYPPSSTLFCFQRQEEKRKRGKRDQGLQQKRQDRQFPAAWPGKDLIVPPPPPWLLPHKRHKPLDPVRLSSASAQLLVSRTRKKGKGREFEAGRFFLFLLIKRLSPNSSRASQAVGLRPNSRSSASKRPAVTQSSPTS